MVLIISGYRKRSLYLFIIFSFAGNDLLASGEFICRRGVLISGPSDPFVAGQIPASWGLVPSHEPSIDASIHLRSCISVSLDTFITFDNYKLLFWKSNNIKFLSVPHLEIKAGHHMLSGYILLEKVTI